jgi:hypothetical protein
VKRKFPSIIAKRHKQFGVSRAFGYDDTAKFHSSEGVSVMDYN